MAKNDNENNLKLGLSLANSKIASQAGANRSVDSKVGILLGFSGAIAAGTLTFIKSDSKLIGVNLFSLGLIMLFGTIACLILASKSRTFLDPPDFHTFYSKKALSKSNIDLLNQIIADTKKCYGDNSLVINTKVKYFDTAIYLLGTSIILLTIGIR
jgi:hypothetical protein